MGAPRATSEQRRILIVDNHPLIRRGLISLLDDAPDLTVCATATTNQEGFESIARCKPDLVIAELSNQNADELSLVKKIRLHYPNLPILVFSMHSTAEMIRRAINAGANDYISKREFGETLLSALRQLLNGKNDLNSKSGNGPEAEK